MEWSNIVLFFTASWFIVITPGPDLIYVMTRGISQGRTAGVVSAFGVTLGILVHTLFAAFGLTLLLKTSALAFTTIKIIGALYLIYLGVQALQKKSSLTLNQKCNSLSLGKIFIQGVFSNVLNPKIALFFLAFIPQFISPQHGNVSVQMAILGFTFALMGVFFLVIVGYYAGNIGKWLSKHENVSNKINWITGGILVGLGIRLAFLEQK
jgi:threonine/homoserine/homoserine lactone efflux protein